MPYNPIQMGGAPLAPGYGYDANGNVVFQGGSPAMSGPDYAGMPTTPYYNPSYDPSTENLADPLQQQLNGIDTNPLSMSVSNFKDLADRQGPSAWATSADQQQDALSSNALERGAAQTNGQTAQAVDQLGSSGGITSGARERAVEGGAKNYMNMSQDTSRQDSLNKLQIGVNDQQNKMQEMGMLPGMESQALQPQFQKANMWEQAKTADVGNQITSTNNTNAFNQNNYQAQLGAWGANQQANATMKSGK